MLPTMKRAEPSSNGHVTPEAKALHQEIVAAQQSLIQARGRALEAQDMEDLAAVLAYLRRASLHVGGAVRKCLELRATRG